MHAGRELDAIVAEKVMGWVAVPVNRWLPKGQGRGSDNSQWLFHHHKYGEQVRPMHSFCPSTDIAAAWGIRVEMERLGWISHDQITWMGWGDNNKHPYEYSIWFENWLKFKEIGGKTCFHAHVKDFKQAPLAICLAALKAKGVDV